MKRWSTHLRSPRCLRSRIRSTPPRKKGATLLILRARPPWCRVTMEFAQVTESPMCFSEACISAFALTHPQGSSGYRIEFGDATFVYATDHEHGEPAADNRLCQAAQGADVLFYDTHFSPEEYLNHQGWGHGTWLEGTCVAREAGVKQLVLFHHDPGHDDAQIDTLLDEAHTCFPNTIAAAEGLVIELAGCLAERAGRSAAAYREK
jgi:hypothetical protein